MSNELLNQKKIKFGPFESALATLFFVILNVLFVETYVTIGRAYGVSELGLLFAQFLVEALFGVAAWAAAGLCKVAIIKAAGLNKKVSVYMVIYAVLIAFVSLFFFANLTGSFLEFLTLLGVNTSSASMDVSNFWNYLGYVIAACVTAGFCEELLFRGAIQSGLKRFGKWTSIISASLIFMLMHGGPLQTIHQFIIGVVVGYIFYETGNLWLSIIIHFFNNFISITELFMLTMITKGRVVEETTDAVQTITMAEAWSNFAINLVISLVLAVIGFFLIRYLIKKLIKENERVNGNANKISETISNQTILVDGNEVETNMSIEGDEVLAAKKPEEETKENKALDTKTIVCFAIPILWLVYQWIIELLSRLG